jgi:hypothetical protein
MLLASDYLYLKCSLTYPFLNSGYVQFVGTFVRQSPETQMFLTASRRKSLNRKILLTRHCGLSSQLAYGQVNCAMPATVLVIMPICERGMLGSAGAVA